MIKARAYPELGITNLTMICDVYHPDLFELVDGFVKYMTEDWTVETPEIIRAYIAFDCEVSTLLEEKFDRSIKAAFFWMDVVAGNIQYVRSAKVTFTK